MFSKPNLPSQLAQTLRTNCENRLSVNSNCYKWSLAVLNIYVNFETEEDEGLFDCFEVEAMRLQLEEIWHC